MTELTGSFSFSSSDPAYGDGDESSFPVSAGGTLQISFTTDAQGDYSGVALLNGVISGFSVGDTDGDDDDFSDNVTTNLQIGGSVATGMTFSAFVGGAYVNFSVTLGTGPSSTGVLSLQDVNMGQAADISVQLTQAPASPPPGVLTLANLANDVYGNEPPVGWQVLNDQYGDPLTFTDSTGEFKATAYLSPDGSQVVLAIRGTDLVPGEYGTGFQNLLTDLATWGSGIPSPEFQTMVAGTAELLSIVAQEYPGLPITLTGHSLGGAVAQLVAEASGYNAEVFNAPGAAGLYDQLSDELAPAAALFSPSNGTGENLDVRAEGDAVSLVGLPIGTTETLVAPSVTTVLSVTPLVGLLVNHFQSTVLSDLGASDLTVVPGVQTDGETAAEVIGISLGIANSTGASLIQSGFSVDVSNVLPAIDGIANAVSGWFDPGPGSALIFAETGASPLITSVSFVADPDAAQFVVWEQVGGAWSDPQTVVPGGDDQTATFGAGVSAFKVEAEDASGQPVLVPNGLIFNATFASAGQVTATATASSGLDSLADLTDFTANGTSDILFGQAGGTLATWEMNATSIVGGGDIGSPGGTWAETALGDFYGDGRTDILFSDTSGDLAIWQMNGTSIVGGGDIGNPGGTWHVAGVGDFNGDGEADILFQDASGNLAIWEMNGTSIIGGGAIGTPGGTWTVKGVGDFNGDGMSDVLFEDAGGDYAIWEMSGTSIIGGGAIGNPGPSWTEKGIGDFYGDGMSDILFENTSGQYAIWEMNGTAIVGGGDIGAPGGTWQFASVGDYNGDGHADILFEDASGNLAIWEMNGTSITGGGDIGNPGSVWHVLG